MCILGDYNLVAQGCALQLNQIVIAAVRGQQRPRVLEVLALGVALERPRHSREIPIAEKNAAIGRRQQVLLPLGEILLGVHPLVHLGKITSINKDARKKVKGAHVNFNVYYEIDENTSNHNLMLDNYGDLGLAEDGQWLLLAKSG